MDEKRRKEKLAASRRPDRASGVQKDYNPKRFLDPRNNKLKLNKFHQKEKTGPEAKHSKKRVSTKIRDLKRFIQHAEDKNLSEIVESKGKELKELNQYRRDGRKKKFIDIKYKHVKMYEQKRVRKTLKRLEKEREEKAEASDCESSDLQALDEQIQEQKNRMIYIKVVLADPVLSQGRKIHIPVER